MTVKVYRIKMSDGSVSSYFYLNRQKAEGLLAELQAKDWEVVESETEYSTIKSQGFYENKVYCD